MPKFIVTVYEAIAVEYLVGTISDRCYGKFL